MTAEEARSLLQAALRRVPRPAAAGTSGPTPTPQTAHWDSRVAGGRSADLTQIATVLYWKE
jgi:hypothetical protein